MARKFLYAIATLVVLIIAGLVVLRVWGLELTRLAMVPGKDFAALSPLPVGSYDDPARWLAHPKLTAGDTAARWIPKGVSAPAAPPAAAIFYVHPTTYLNRAEWNAPLADTDANDRAEMIARMQVSAFNAAGELWAPRYRQATFGTFLTDKPAAKEAQRAAYKDVEVAFATFLKAIGPDRPIILAGHSQGALHLIYLLRDHVAGKPVAKRIVAAYPIGWPISVTGDLPALGLPACTGANRAGCVMSWQSFAEPAETETNLDGFDQSTGLTGKSNKGSAMLCANPLTGGASAAAPASANLGTLKTDAEAKTGELLKGIIPARCDGRGFLLIGEPIDLGRFIFPGNNYHVYDYNLFWANLRADALTRLAAFQAAK